MKTLSKEMKDKISELQAIRKIKYKSYTDTPAYSWKKKLYKIEIEIIDGKLKRERLRRQFR